MILRILRVLVRLSLVGLGGLVGSQLHCKRPEIQAAPVLRQVRYQAVEVLHAGHHRVPRPSPYPAAVQEAVAAARGEVNPDDLRADKLLDDIRKERNRTSREREKLEKARARLETQTQALDTRLDKMEDERREMLARARAEGELEVAVLKENIAALKAQLRKARQPLDALKEIEQKVEPEHPGHRP